MSDKKINCWEFKGCGRIPGGINEDNPHICNAYKFKMLTGINDGKFGGRSCWAAAGTMCKGYVDATYCKTDDCNDCEFHLLVIKEEGEKYRDANHILEIIRTHFTK